MSGLTGCCLNLRNANANEIPSPFAYFFREACTSYGLKGGHNHQHLESYTKAPEKKKDNKPKSTPNISA